MKKLIVICSFLILTAVATLLVRLNFEAVESHPISKLLVAESCQSDSVAMAKSSAKTISIDLTPASIDLIERANAIVSNDSMAVAIPISVSLAPPIESSKKPNASEARMTSAEFHRQHRLLLEQIKAHTQTP